MPELHQVRRFAAEPDRVETGPIMFGDDWPGIFIRGDQAFAFTFALRAAVNHGNIDPLYRVSLQGLLDTLRSCDCRYNNGFPAWHQNVAEDWT